MIELDGYEVLAYNVNKETKTFFIHVRCEECSKKGKIIVSPSNDGKEVKKYIKHKRGCSKKPKQPKHFLKDRKKWQRGEKRGNEIVGAKETKVSGALNKDGDGRIINEWRVETKTTSKNSYRLTKTVWEKLAAGAIACGEEPIFYVETSFASFVVYKSTKNEGKMSISTSPQSLSLSKELALQLNRQELRGGQLLEGWPYSPCVTLRKNFTKEQI